MTTSTASPHRQVVERAGLRNQYGLFIGGSSASPRHGRTTVTFDPTDEDPIAEVGIADESDVQDAVDAARSAQASWGRTPWQERSRALRLVADQLEANAESFALIDTIDGGIPVRSMANDVVQSIASLRYFAGVASEITGESVESSASTLTTSVREPYGVVGRILPFNHPLQFAAMAIAAPLAAGNAVILKPSDHTPLSALHLAELTTDLLPPGLVNVVTGNAATGRAIVTHPEIPRIAFTGTIATGRAILRDAAEGIKSVSLELGAKNPMIVFPDVHVPTAAQAAVDAMNICRCQGQSCGSPSRIYAHVDIHDDFVAAVAEILTRVCIGDPADPGTEMGPLAYRAHYDSVLRHIALAVDEGARLVYGGSRPEELDRGLYIQPSLFDRVRPDMTVAREEIFGPVMAVLPWTDEHEVLEQANSLDVGLAAYVWTNDLTSAVRVAKSLSAGYIWINGRGQRPVGAPFGGYKLSGLGAENYRGELLSYTRTKTLTIWPSR